MVEATLTKARVVYNKTFDPTFLGIAEHDDEALNIKVEFDWETFEPEDFANGLRQQIAKDFDLEVKFVDIRREQLTEMLATSYWEYMHRFGKLLH